MKTLSAQERSPLVTRVSARQTVSMRFYARELWHHRGLIRILAGRNLKSQYEMNVLGFAWWLLDPLTFALVYYVIVAVIFKSAEPAYPLFLVVALLPFKWFVTSIVGAMSTVRNNGNLITNLYFPRALLPVTEISIGLSHFAVGLLIIPPFMAVYGVGPTWHLLWLPVVVAVQFLFMIALSFPSAIWGLHYRNLPGLTANLLRLWFYLSPGIWALSRVKNPTLRLLIELNPLTGLFTSYRGAILTHESPSWTLAYTAGIGLVGLLVGGIYFVRREAQFGKVIQ